MNRFNVSRIKLRGEWAFNVVNDTCAICRNNIMDKSIHCTVGSNDPNTCLPVMGKCGHCYHSDCINFWLNTRNVCPLCNQKWEYKRKKVKVT